MNLQSDLFGEPTATLKPAAVNAAPDCEGVRTLALPCGFMNSRNNPCDRLGSRAVMIDGAPLVCRGVAMVHCKPECFRVRGRPAPSYNLDDFQPAPAVADASTG